MILFKILEYLYPKLIFLLALFDAEKIHEWSLKFLKLMARPHSKSHNIRTQQNFSSSAIASASGTQVFSIPFKNRIGLAAGLDKNGEAILGFQKMGFGFVEIGTVTPRPQFGNPRPRLFRDFHNEYIFNSMGFNNCGAEQMLKNIDKSRPHWDPDFVVGINIGKNADTPLEEAHQDYISCAKKLGAQAHYLCVNVSSPNTLGLRSLQNIDHLSRIINGVANEITKINIRPPLLVKLAPEIPKEEFQSLINQLETFPIDGWVLTNTLQRPSTFKQSQMKLGGLSGAPLTEASFSALKFAREITKKPIVSVGGILSAEEAKRRFDHGANLIQIYSGLIFKGPHLIRQIRQDLA